MRRILFLLFLALQGASAFGQAKKGEALMQPTIWDRVRYAHGDNQYYQADGQLGNEEYWRFPISSETTKAKWWVFTNRPDVKLRVKHDHSAADIPTPFKLSHRFHVFDEWNDWLQVGTDAKREPEGWCHKKDLILWYEPLVDPRTRIELKAFMVNTSEATSEAQKGQEQYQVFDGPTSNTVLQSPLLYDVLFVYGYSDEGNNGGRYLVSAHSLLGPQSPLLGWVSRKRVKIWTTRLCLEPNFDAQAVERRRAAKLYAKLFSNTNTKGLETYLSTGQGKGLVDGPTRDPAANTSSSDLRMPPRLFRYPVFDANWIGAKQDNCKFTTGVSAKNNLQSGGLVSMDETRWLKLQSNLEQERKNLGQINVIFLVEGGGDTKDHFDLVKSSIGAIRTKVGSGLRYGAVVYRNEYASLPKDKNPETEFLETLELTSSADQALEWVGGRLPHDAGDPGEGRAVYAGLKKAFGMLRDNETNVIVHISRRPDNGRDIFFDGKTKVDLAAVCAALPEEKNVHYLGFVTLALGEKTPSQVRRDAFEGMEADILTNIANTLSNRYQGISEIAQDKSSRVAAPMPQMRKENGMDVVQMSNKGFILKGHLLTTAQGHASLTQAIADGVDGCKQLNASNIELMQQVLAGNSAISDRAGDFTDDIAPLVDRMGMSPEEWNEWAATKRTHYFVDAATYYRTNAPALKDKEPLFRYVLFYSAKGLKEEISSLEQLLNQFNQEDFQLARSSMVIWWKQRAKDVLGNAYNDKVSALEVRERLLGIHAMNMVKPFPEDAYVLKRLTISDLESKSKFTTEEFTTYFTEVRARLNELKKLQTQGEYYEVQGDNSGERKYFWVPIELLFN